MVNSVLRNACLKDLAIRVKNRDKMIDFYRNVLKFRLISEENAVAFFGVAADKEIRFTLEESPEYRTRAVVGEQKLHVFQIRLSKKEDFLATAGEILKRELPIEFAWKKGEAMGFVLRDPEGNRVGVYVSDVALSAKDAERVELSTLVEKEVSVDTWSEAKIDYLKLNVPNLEVAKAFYEKAFQLSFNERQELSILDDFTLALTERSGEDLIGNVDKLWDIEYVEIFVENSEEIKRLIQHFSDKEIEFFVDKKHQLFTISDTSGLEWWFMLQK
ncbi:catechol 2,3-dioxygenase [Pilibacter termitis]|uniref:Catechol 2,3-dioxygenase n=1 Tax=Pilibacter termitis TaxID=263852 RepID=A0A1T4NJR0_9ENTE|nr:CppA N-terminal domain-containing protein [Pilibacter termitis]SJZ79520.1 catechol 2,3-dioxygenase [Pilibacter termitis]